MMDISLVPCLEIVSQITMAAAAAERDQKDCEMAEPRRPSAIRSKVTASVLDFLRVSGKFVREHEVRRALGIAHPAACWALLSLRKNGLVDAVPDTARNSRYLRYRAKKWGGD